MLQTGISVHVLVLFCCVFFYFKGLKNSIGPVIAAVYSYKPPIQMWNVWVTRYKLLQCLIYRQFSYSCNSICSLCIWSWNQCLYLKLSNSWTAEEGCWAPDLSCEPSSVLPSIHINMMLKNRCCWWCFFFFFLTALCIGREDTRGTHSMVLLWVWDFMTKTKLRVFKKAI